MRRVTIVALVLAVACGDDLPSAREELVGLWGVELSGGCALVIGLDDSGDYAATTACPLDGGGLAAEVWAGAWLLDRGQLVLRSERSTCRGARPRTERTDYDLAGDSIVITRSTGAILLERIDGDDEGGATGVAAFGCWGDDGSFTPAPLTEL